MFPSAQPQIDLAIVIVSWNVGDLLRRCLHSIAASLQGSGLRWRILVVDNASADGTPEMLRAEFPQVELIETGANLGFAGGNNVALRALGLAEPSRPDAARYTLLLNPDTEIQADALVQLVRHLDTHPDLVAVGPQLRYADGSIQSSRRRFPQRATFFWESTPLHQLWPTNPWAQRYHYAERSPEQPLRVGWLVGAALLVRSSAIRSAGLLDERFFMYSEELEWQLRLQHTVAASERMPAIEYLPSAVVIHYEGKSSEQAIAARHINFQRSKLLLARMLFGWQVAALLRTFLVVCYSYEVWSEAAKLVLGHRPDLRRQRIDVYRTVLRVGLREEP